MRRYLFLVLAIGLVPGGALAQEIPCPDGPCVRSREKGTHFFVEVNGGGTLVGGLGLMVGGIFGAGGKLKRLPLRFYAITEFAYSSSTDEGFSPRLGVSFRDARARRELGFALRIYAPIWGSLRLFGDLGGGATYVTASLSRDGLTTISSDTWEGMAFAAAGLQVRVISQLSLGARARFVLTGEEPDKLRAAMGSSPLHPMSFMAGMTWHF